MSNVKELLLVADVETTGLSTKTDRVCQIGIVGAFVDREARDVEYFEIVDRLCKPRGKIISDETAKIHGVSQSMVDHLPYDDVVVAEAWNATMDIVTQFHDEYPDGHITLSGYNSDRYDWPLLSNVHSPILHAIADPGVWRLDGLVLAQRLYKGMSHKLGVMYKHLFNEEPVNAHNAAADCIMTARVMARMMTDNNLSLQAAVEMTSKVMIMETMPFGKHEGKRCDEIPISYFRWCKNNWTDISPDMLATINHQLQTRERK